ncbi:hypothetical protein GCM10023151_00030 [Kangiella marina]|uniref:RNA polymerase subunit sigma-24 n=2 Tax=Kangiella marina TaxID=1079178 RepID=A0ABP8I9D1_9GAMM
MLRDEHRANDVLQTVMLKVIKTIASLSDISKFNGWLKRITYNTTIDLIRLNQRLVDVGDEVEFDYATDEVLSHINKPGWDLDTFLAILQERERVVVWLYAIEGLSHSEVANQLNISEQNSRIIFSRAMKSLKTLAADERYSGKKVGDHNE